MENKDKETFNYTYSAKLQEEIRFIRNKYDAPKEDKMTQLRRLDANVTHKASSVALAVGIIGALILGFGMSLLMSELSEIFGSHQNIATLIGFITGFFGIVLVCFAYPMYNRIIKKERERIAPEIIRLTDELMK